MHGGMRCLQAPLIVAGSPLQEPIRPTYAMRQGVVGAASLEANVLWRRAAVALKRCYVPGGIVRCMSSIFHNSEYYRIPVVPARGGAEVALGFYYKTLFTYTYLHNLHAPCATRGVPYHDAAHVKSTLMRVNPMQRRKVWPRTWWTQGRCPAVPGIRCRDWADHWSAWRWTEPSTSLTRVYLWRIFLWSDCPCASLWPAGAFSRYNTRLWQLVGYWHNESLVRC